MVFIAKQTNERRMQQIVQLFVLLKGERINKMQ